MGSRIFMSVPDGPYWKAKEAKERARNGSQPTVVGSVRGTSPKRPLKGERRPDNER